MQSQSSKITVQSSIICLLVIFCGGLLGFLGLSLGSRLLPMGSFNQNLNLHSTAPENYFTVIGDAKLSAIPDQAIITLGVTITKPNVQAAQDEVNTISNNLKDELIKLGLDKKDIQTQNYSLYPNYDWTSSVQRITGYTVNTNLEITLTDFTLLNQVIDLATTSGINQISNIGFSLSDAKQNELKQTARAIAIEQAKKNANDLAQLAGIKLGSIVNVQENQNSNYPQPILYKSAMTDSFAVGGVPTNVEAGETDYTYQVSLSYQTL